MEWENKDNYKIRIIELSKIGYLIKDEISDVNNYTNFTKEIFGNNTNLILQKITNIINNIKNNKNIILIIFFQDIKNTSFQKYINYFHKKFIKNFIARCVLY